MILTSNQSFGAWGEVFGDRVIATAILDRVLHHAITINIRGSSYRLKDKLKARTHPSRRACGDQLNQALWIWGQCALQRTRALAVDNEKAVVHRAPSVPKLHSAGPQCLRENLSAIQPGWGIFMPTTGEN
jgi:hypothetical protein